MIDMYSILSTCCYIYFCYYMLILLVMVATMIVLLIMIVLSIIKDYTNLQFSTILLIVFMSATTGLIFWSIYNNNFDKMWILILSGVILLFVFMYRDELGYEM